MPIRENRPTRSTRKTNLRNKRIETTAVAMRWDKLLSTIRQGKQGQEQGSVGRSDFQRDYDRIVYSSAFRRLQDKAQVFPLAKSDFVRTRLTHSVEVSCVGRSLGTEIGLKLRSKASLHDPLVPSDVGDIVAAACLAHDIGNPPFGHTGEAAIAEWFRDSKAGREVLKGLSPNERADFEKFEGNAQGFRILTRLQNHQNPGLQLTYSTLAAFTKYPRDSPIVRKSLPGVSWKKHGYFQSEKPFFEEVARGVGLLSMDANASAWTRHPLAYLVEAADDICYRINDWEDGFRLKHVSQTETEERLEAIFPGGKLPSKLDRIFSPEDRVAYLRAKAINELIEQAVTFFMQQEEVILRGGLPIPLIEGIPSAKPLSDIYKDSKTKIYKAKEVLEIEVPGFTVLGGLLEVFLGAVNEVAVKGEKEASTKSKTILQIVPPQFLAGNRLPDESPYVRTLQVTDFVSGMTDSFAVALYKQITGISLPS